ncbi:MAG TPA: cytochrome B [Oxalobacteraceae bacterium]|jgi:Ni/Fe-hydrogenase b-type cytochrome subunit|nr:cytochrome B [Oxalobacteraceae bacterium]
MSKQYLHPLPVRIWHWTNALCFILLIVSGTQIRYLGLISLMPFRTAVAVHNFVGFVLIGNFCIWLTFYLFSDKNKAYHPELNLLKQSRECFQQLKYYGYGIFKGDPSPHHAGPFDKFNPLQRMLYQVLMLFLLPAQFFTGLLLWDIKRFSGIVDLLGGVRVVDTVHVLIYIFFVFYILIHPYLATLGHTPTEHIKAMISGYEDVEEESEVHTVA